MTLEGETNKYFIEQGDHSTASAPQLYPNLNSDTQNVDTQDSIYRLNRCNAILEELKEEKKHYESTYKKYKKLHKTLYTTQLFCNTTSIFSGGCTVGTLATGVGSIAAVPLGLVGMVSGGIGIMLGTFDQKALKKMKKHSKLVQLCQTIDNQVIKKYLSDQVISKEEFTEILTMMEKYYTEKEEIRTKNILIGNLDNLKKEFVEKGKKMAYLEAVRNNPKTELLISKVV